MKNTGRRVPAFSHPCRLHRGTVPPAPATNRLVKAILIQTATDCIDLGQYATSYPCGPATTSLGRLPTSRGPRPVAEKADGSYQRPQTSPEARSSAYRSGREGTTHRLRGVVVPSPAGSGTLPSGSSLSTSSGSKLADRAASRCRSSSSTMRSPPDGFESDVRHMLFSRNCRAAVQGWCSAQPLENTDRQYGFVGTRGRAILDRVLTMAREAPSGRPTWYQCIRTDTDNAGVTRGRRFQA